MTSTPVSLRPTELLDDDRLNEIYRYLQLNRRECLPDFEVLITPYVTSVPDTNERLQLIPGREAEAGSKVLELLAVLKVFTENFRLLQGAPPTRQAGTPVTESEQEALTYGAQELELFGQLWREFPASYRATFSEDARRAAQSLVKRGVLLAGTGVEGEPEFFLSERADNLPQVAALVEHLGLLAETPGQQALLFSAQEAGPATEDWLGPYASATADDTPSGGSASGMGAIGTGIMGGF